MDIASYEVEKGGEDKYIALNAEEYENLTFIIITIDLSENDKNYEIGTIDNNFYLEKGVIVGKKIFYDYNRPVIVESHN